MRSPADRAVLLERAARAASFALLAFALWRMLAVAATGGTMRVSASSLGHDLPAVESARATALHVALDAAPAPAERDALAAVSHAGTLVSWSGRALPPLAAVAARAREPGGPVRVAVASPEDVRLADGLAALDTVRASSAARGATITLGEPSGAVDARSGSMRALVAVPEAAPLRAVLVVGRAGWEAKFTVAALEEQGWSVEERLAVAPGADVAQGAVAAIDTSRFSAIVALDTTLGAVGPQIARFVHDGGGLVLLANAAGAPAMRALAPAIAGTRRPARVRAFDVADPVSAMPVYPLENLRADAVRLSVRGPVVTAAARRAGAGRVLQLAFDETWRWRMQGGADGVARHRAWWSRIVGSVAFAPLARGAASTSAEGAPLARLVDALGPPSAGAAGSPSPARLPAWILPALLVLLLAEWASRRWRGAR